MGEWKETTIGGIVALQRGYDLPQAIFEDGPYKVAGSNGPIGYHNKWNAKGPGITLGRSGNSIGVVHFYEDNFWAHNTTLFSVTFYDSDPKFLYYFFRNVDFKSFDAGSAIPSLNRNHLYPVRVKVPLLDEQREIAAILSSLDAKIDLLHRQNKTLEQLAEALFRQWFVVEADPNWKVGQLCRLFDIGIGRTPPRKESIWFSADPTDIKWISIKDMGTSGLYIDTVSEYLTGEAVERFNIPIIPENTVLLSFKMTIGRLAITTGKVLSNEAIAHFKQKGDSNLYSEFLYLFLKTYKWEQLGSTSSIVEAVNSRMIKDIEITIPDKLILDNFRDSVAPFFSKIRKNQIQIRTLTQLRDTLLPKLMSGEVRVKGKM